MANLTTTPASGEQTTTQNPQTAGSQTGGASTQSGTVQPGTAVTLLTSQNGLPLQTSFLTTVSLNSTTAQTTPPVVPVKKHVNPALFGVSIVLVLIAIGLFWATSRSAKNTTNLK